MRDALHHLLENEPTQRWPVKLQTDQGKEFYNQHVKQLLDQYGIHHYSIKGEPRAVIAERFNHTLKELTYKYMTAHPEVPERLTPAVGPLQPMHSFQHQHGTGRREPSQRRGGLATVFQAHRTLQPLQLSTGQFHENFQNAGKRQEARGLRSQNRQGRVVAGHVHGPCDGPGSVVVRRCQLLSLGRLARPASQGSFLRASTAKGERPAQPLRRGQKA